jgi:hypothetical protein
MTVIVKTAVISNRHGGDARVIINAFSPGSTAAADLVNHTYPYVVEPYRWDGWVVVGEHGSITAYSDVASVDIWISGTMLQGVAPLPPSSSQQPVLLPPPLPYPEPPTP